MSVHSPHDPAPRRRVLDYKVDLRDIKFQLFEWLRLGELIEAEKFADWDTENIEMVLSQWKYSFVEVLTLGCPY